MRRQLADMSRIKNKSLQCMHKQHNYQLLNESENTRKPLYIQLSKANDTSKLSTQNLKPFKFRVRDASIFERLDVTPLRENPIDYKFRQRVPKKNLSGEFRYKPRSTIERIMDFKRENGLELVGDTCLKHKRKPKFISPLFDNIFTHYGREKVRKYNLLEETQNITTLQ